MGEYSAGILLYHISFDGQISFLLGKDRRGKWSDFGGKSEESDNNDTKQTASREFYEETIGTIMSLNTVRHIIENCPYVQGKSYLQNPYYMYIVQVLHKNAYSDDFKESYKFVKNSLGNNSPFCEKVDIQWINYDAILKNANNDVRQVFHNTFNNNIESINKIIARKMNQLKKR